MSTPFPTINESLLADQGAGPVPRVSAPVAACPPPPLTAGRVVLPGKGPLLTRAGWSAFLAALIAV